MEAVYYGRSTGGLFPVHKGTGDGPWVMADLENGLWGGNANALGFNQCGYHVVDEGMGIGGKDIVNGLGRLPKNGMPHLYHQVTHLIHHKWD